MALGVKLESLVSTSLSFNTFFLSCVAQVLKFSGEADEEEKVWSDQCSYQTGFQRIFSFMNYLFIANHNHQCILRCIIMLFLLFLQIMLQNFAIESEHIDKPSNMVNTGN